MTSRPRVTLERYVAAVSLLGIGGASAVVVLGRHDLVFSATAILLLATAVVLEWVPIRVPRRGFTEEITTSFTFVFALLLFFGLPFTVLAQAIASASSDARRGKPLQRILFNVGQTSLTVIAGGSVLWLLSDVPQGERMPFSPGDVPIIIVAALVLFAFNNVLVSIVSALSQAIPVRAHIRHDTPFQASIALLLLGMSPIVVLVCAFSLWLLPLVLLPMVAVHRAGLAAVRDNHRAHHDDLTGLPNRTQFALRSDVALQTAAGDGISVAFVVVDLDRFKEINDTLGHQQGDELLRLVATRLAGAMRPDETAARFGGDEFAVVSPLTAGKAGVTELADRILTAFGPAFALADLLLTVDVSLGITLWPDHGTEIDELLRRADVALYQAKESFLDVVIYDPSQDDSSPERLTLLGELRHGIVRGELRLAYMPKVALDTGEVLGMEALVRWDHPRHGVLPPGAFIPHAERTGLIGALTLEVLDLALAQAAAWAKGGNPVRVAVNLSARNLLDRGLPDAVRERMRAHGTDASLLELEITESTIMADPARALVVLEELAEMGIALTIDDFGTGYSSLAYLKRLPVSTLKIDRSFVTSMLDDAQDALIVQSTIDLGRNLGLNVVAEGIEDDATRLTLAGLGCHAGQGFLFGVPASADALETPPRLRSVSA